MPLRLNLSALSIGGARAVSASAAAPLIPATQTIAFGAKTRKGFGGHNLAYTGVAVLSITAGNTGTIWKIDNRNHLVPNGTYGAAPPSYSGPYTLTVTDGTYSSTVTVNITTGSSGAAHIREMTTTPSAVNQDDGSVDQIKTMLELQYDASGGLAGGDKILCRDGTYNPAQNFGIIAPSDPKPFCASGRITIASENPDATNDASGLPNRGGGFKLGYIKFNMFSAQTTVAPLDFVDISFYYNNPSVAATDFLDWSNSDLGGATFTRVRTEFGALIVAGTASYDGAAGALNANGSGVFTNCYFKNVPYGVKGETPSGASGTLLTVTGCVGVGIISDFIQSLGVGLTITDNFAKDWGFSSGNHPDFCQHLGFQDNAAHANVGTWARNIAVRGTMSANSDDAQGPFLNNSTGTTTLGNVSMMNNIMLNTCGNGYFLERCTAPVVRYNTGLEDFQSNSLSFFASQIFAENGSNGNFDYNVTQANMAAAVAGQSGSPTIVGNLVLNTITLAAYQAAFPDYTNAIHTRAQAITAMTPLAGGSCHMGANKYSGALFPVNDFGEVGWNDGSAFDHTAHYTQAV